MKVTNLSSKVDMLGSDLKSNRVTRDSVVTDLESVNQLAVRLNTEKIDLINRIGKQNSQVGWVGENFFCIYLLQIFYASRWRICKENLSS